MLTRTRRFEPVRKYNGTPLASSYRLDSGHRCINFKHHRSVGRITQKVELFRTKILDEQFGFCRLMYGRLLVVIGVRRFCVQRELFQLCIQLAKW